MKRVLRFAAILFVALAIVPFLPLYIERTLMRSWHVDRTADTIDWGWKLVSLGNYLADYNYFAREQQPELWLSVNLALALTYALIMTACIDQVLIREKRRRQGNG